MDFLSIALDFPQEPLGQGKFPANEAYAKDLAMMTMDIGEEMVLGSGALSNFRQSWGQCITWSGMVMVNLPPTALGLPDQSHRPNIKNTRFSTEIPHNLDYLEGDGIGSSPAFTGAVQEICDRLHRC